MNQAWRSVCAAAAIGCSLAATQISLAVELDFVGSQIDLSPFYSNGATPPCCIVPWRSDSPGNTFAVSNEVPNRYYGTAGYALFATRFDYPDQNLGYTSTVTDPIFTANDLFVDKIELPSFVTNSQILSSHKAAGWAYSLIDDPVLQHGYREWTFDGANYPPAAGPCPGPNCNVTGGIPYVKLGLLTGNDILGNNPGEEPTARWGFEVGEDTPETFRVGVITDGLDASFFAAGEVFLTHLIDEVPVTTISSGQVSRNRFVDIHFFDITNAQAGDQFVFSAMRGPGDPDYANAGISGFTFDVVSTTNPGVPGDYNNDGEVNAADYTVWRDHLGQTFQLDNEGPDTPGSVTAEDYNFWKSQFGGGGGAAAVGVPEPGSIVLLMMAVCAVAIRRRRS
jgi:hypothetical protein